MSSHIKMVWGLRQSMIENIILSFMLKFIVQLKTLMVIMYNVDGLKVYEGNVMTYALYSFQLF